VGSIESNSDLLSITGRYSGVAPNAKVAFVDLGTPGSGIFVPSTAAALFNAARSAGARIYTNSWGALYSTGSFYSASDLDNYLYVNPTAPSSLRPVTTGKMEEATALRLVAWRRKARM
jgi:hypothetical protein